MQQFTKTNVSAILFILVVLYAMIACAGKRPLADMIERECREVMK